MHESMNESATNLTNHVERKPKRIDFQGSGGSCNHKTYNDDSNAQKYYEKSIWKLNFRKSQFWSASFLLLFRKLDLWLSSFSEGAGCTKIFEGF